MSQELQLLLVIEYGSEEGVDVCGRAEPGRAIGQVTVQPLSCHGNSCCFTVGHFKHGTRMVPFPSVYNPVRGRSLFGTAVGHQRATLFQTSCVLFMWWLSGL